MLIKVRIVISIIGKGNLWRSVIYRPAGPPNVYKSFVYWSYVNVVKGKKFGLSWPLFALHNVKVIMYVLGMLFTGSF